MSAHVEIITGLSVRVGGVILAAVIDELERTVKIEQTGEPLNGEVESLARARVLLASRVQRTRPDLKVIA